MRDLFKSLDKKKVKNLTEQQLEALESERMIELINKMSALDLIDYKDLGGGKLLVTVKKAKSSKDFTLKLTADYEVLKHNCQEDVRSYGVVRSNYCDSLPEIPLDFFVERLESVDDPDIDRRRFLDKMCRANPVLHQINSENSWFKVVCKESRLTGWPKTTIIFNNDIIDMRVPKRMVPFFKSLDKNQPIEARLNLGFYLNRDGDIAYSFEVVEATIDGVNFFSKNGKNE